MPSQPNPPQRPEHSYKVGRYLTERRGELTEIEVLEITSDLCYIKVLIVAYGEKMWMNISDYLDEFELVSVLKS